MTLSETQLSEIDTLARHEEAISHLYDAYAEKFPDHCGFWEKLSKEELNHAAWTRVLRSKVEDGSLVFNEGRFKVEAIESSIRYMESWTNQAKSEEMSMLNALSIALDVENALLDRKFFEVYEGDAAEMKRILKKLQDASLEHRDRVAKALTEERQGESRNIVPCE